MFWGLLLEPGKRYSTTVEKSFHVSMAALDCSSVRSENEILSVVLETEGSEALLCNLCKQMGILQDNLDLNFMTGDRLTFECRGHGRVHLTGYLLPDDEDDVSGMLGDDESEEEEDDSGWLSQSANKDKSKKEKRKLDGPPELSPKKRKTSNDDEDESDSDADGSDFDLSDGMDDEDLDDEELDDEDSDKDEDEDSDDDEEEEEDSKIAKQEALSKKAKQKQQQKPDKNKTPSKQNLDTSNKKTPVTNGLTPKEQKSNKKTPSVNKTSNNQLSQQRKVLDMGVVVKEIKTGTGTPAKPGRMVSVHYIGKLRDGGKVFDKQLKGEPFKFKLGKGEVIKGWDIGLQGMKIGGKRIIHCPPEAAYGAKGVPPKIPANSALIFEVELKGVN